MIFHPPVKCKHCDYIVYGNNKSRAKRMIEAHFEVHHVLKHCEYCDFESLSKVEVKNHKLKVHICKKCDFVAANSETLKKHMKFHSYGARMNCDFYVVV